MAKVMVVDDSPLIRKNITSLFETYTSHKVVVEACNGVDALQKYKEFKPDLVTMDITMPVQGGLAAAKQIKADFPDAKIIIVSSSSEKEIVIEALQSGAIGYLVKPINTQKFLSVVNALFMPDSQITDSSEIEPPITT